MTVLIRDEAMRDVLASAKVIAVVGHSDKPHRTSYQIAAYLRQAGYRVIPVNPTVESIDGERAYASLADVPEPVDIVDVFRRSEHLPGVVAEVAALAGDHKPVVWGQLGVLHPEAVRLADTHGLDLVMDRCIKVEHRRLLG
jgi:predicted CoA-binding protein